MTVPNHRDAGGAPLTAVTPGAPVRGAVLVLPAGGVVTDRVLDMLQLLAEERWLAASVSVQVPAVATEHGHYRPAVIGQVREHALDQVDAALDWVGEQGHPRQRVGVLGLGTGGALALLVGGQREVGAAVTLTSSGIINTAEDGLPEWPVMVGELRCPWLGLLGVDDPSAQTGRPAVHAAQQAAHQTGALAHVVSYPPDGTRRWAPSEDDTTLRLLDWFDSHLR